jgi:hypothetical protein
MLFYYSCLGRKIIMNVTFTIDQEDNQLLAVYFSISKGKVHRTVEVAPGKCYVDEDAKGKPIGVELLAPGEVRLMLRELRGKYTIPEVDKAYKTMKTALSGA